MHTKQMVLTQFREDLTLQEAPVKLSQPGEVLVNIVEVGVCQCDIQAWQGLDQHALLPMVPGHEGLGRVMDVRGDKSDIQGHPIRQGDLVVWNRDVSCGKCHFCTVLREPEHCPWRVQYGSSRNGSFTEYQVLDANTDILKIEGDWSVELMSLAVCAGGTVARVMELRPPTPQETVLIIGSGSVGVFAAAFAKSLGVQTIIVVGSTERRLQACRQAGATHVLNRTLLSYDERARIIREWTETRGADWVLEAGGTVEALREAMDAVRPGGTCFTAGFGAVSGTFALDPSVDLIQKGLTLRGVWQGRMQHVIRACQLVRDHAEAFQGLVTHRFHMDRATEALRAAGQMDAVKAVLVP